MSRFILRRENRERVHAFIDSLPDIPWLIEVTEYKPKRSLEQNAYLWGVCYATILKESPLEGWRADDLHDYMLGECFGWETIEGFGRKRIRPVKRSSKLNKQEFSDYLEFVHQKAAEYGVFIPEAKHE